MSAISRQSLGAPGLSPQGGSLRRGVAGSPASVLPVLDTLWGPHSVGGSWKGGREEGSPEGAAAGEAGSVCPCVSLCTPSLHFL